MNEFLEMIQVYSELVYKYYGGWFWVIVYFICFIYLFIQNKNFRYKLGYPILLIGISLLIPFLYYKIWKPMLGDTFWRILWIMNEFVVIPLAFIEVVRRIRKNKIKIIVLVFGVGLILSMGTFAYKKNAFEIAENPYKLRQSTIDIADYLLEQDEKPLIVTERKVYNQIRQYSDDIHLLYGRDVQGFTLKVWDTNIIEVSKTLKKKSPDFAFVTEICRKHSVKYLVIRMKKNMDDLVANGWRQMKQIDDYYIYVLDE